MRLPAVRGGGGSRAAGRGLWGDGTARGSGTRGRQCRRGAAAGLARCRGPDGSRREPGVRLPVRPPGSFALRAGPLDGRCPSATKGPTFRQRERPAPERGGPGGRIGWIPRRGRGARRRVLLPRLAGAPAAEWPARGVIPGLVAVAADRVGDPAPAAGARRLVDSSSGSRRFRGPARFGSSSGASVPRPARVASSLNPGNPPVVGVRRGRPRNDSPAGAGFFGRGAAGSRGADDFCVRRAEVRFAGGPFRRGSPRPRFL